MNSRHHLLADLEEQRRKGEEAGVEIVSLELALTSAEPGYNPYDNPGAGKTACASGAARERGRKKR